jgi:hypothetical protein
MSMERVCDECGELYEPGCHRESLCPTCRPEEVAVTETFQQSETERVTMWRAWQLQLLGAEPALADALAERDLDTHELEHLLRRGCGLELALRILEPL